jgi:chromosome segregation ATPase
MPDLINQICLEFTAVAAQLEQRWQRHCYNVQQELNNERQTNQELMDKVIGMEEDNIKLQQEQEKNREIVKELRVKLAGEDGKVIAVHDGLFRDLKECLDDHFERFKASQRQIQELEKSNEQLFEQVQSGNAEIANLTKVLKICTDDGQPGRKRPRQNAAKLSK